MKLRIANARSNLRTSDQDVGHEPEMDTLEGEPLPDGLMAEERRTKILQIVRSTGRVKVNELASRFETSAVTIRNDLNDLHQRGLVFRSHGGAVLLDTIRRESPVHERMIAGCR